MIPHLGHWIRVALATLFSCIALYETATDGLGDWTTWVWLAAAAIWVFCVTIEGVRLWRRAHGPTEDGR